MTTAIDHHLQSSSTAPSRRSPRLKSPQTSSEPVVARKVTPTAGRTKAPQQQLLIPSQDEDNLFEETANNKNFMTFIFPILAKIFACKRGSPVYKFNGMTFESEERLRQWICEHGIPQAETLTPEEFDYLSTWARYTNVRRSDFFHGYGEYSEENIHTVLGQMELTRAPDGTYYTENGTKCGDLASLRILIRTHGASAIHRRFTNVISKEDQVNLRVWAARSPAPLPPYATTVTAAKGATKDDETTPTSEAQEQQTKKRFALWPWMTTGEKEAAQEEERPAKKPRRESWFRFGKLF